MTNIKLIYILSIRYLYILLIKFMYRIKQNIISKNKKDYKK